MAAECHVLELQQLRTGMVRREAGRDPFEAVAADRPERGDERGALEHPLHQREVVCHHVPPRRQLSRLRMPHSAAGEHLARLHVEVGADPAAVAGPRKARRYMRLVGRLVCGEADVSVDPERRMSGIRPKWKAACLEPPGKGKAQTFQRLLEQTLVFGLPRLEPRPLVVQRQLDQELDGVAREAGERCCHDHRFSSSGLATGSDEAGLVENFADLAGQTLGGERLGQKRRVTIGLTRQNRRLGVAGHQHGARLRSNCR